MYKPKELIGKVVKIEYYTNNYLTYFYYDPISLEENPRWLAEQSRYYAEELNIIIDFYKQSFNPEMIRVYFKRSGNPKKELFQYENSDCLIDYKSFYIFEDQGKWFFGIYIEPNLHSKDRVFGYKIETLSDFIDACVNNEINLEWK